VALTPPGSVPVGHEIVREGSVLRAEADRGGGASDRGMPMLRHMLETMSWKYVFFYVRLKVQVPRPHHRHGRRSRGPPRAPTTPASPTNSSTKCGGTRICPLNTCQFDSLSRWPHGAIQRDNRSSLKDCVAIHIFYVSDLMVSFIFFIVFDEFSS
jgi:hypothetical protein